MIKLNKKRKILLRYTKGKSISEIVNEIGGSRNTIVKYINEYDNTIRKLIAKTEAGDDIEAEALIEELSKAPSYNTSNRTKRKLTYEMQLEIDKKLNENDEKRKLGQRKMIMKNIDIHEYLEEQGYVISYTTVSNYIRKNHFKKEAYIKQDYTPGRTIEFDWGEVPLIIDGVEKKYKMGLFTTAYGNYHFAKVYNNEKTQSLLDMHVECFKEIGVVHEEIVYDNMKTAVKKFVGLYEKEATDALKSISMFYGFDYRFCNIAKGNEKGTVEKGVEFVRRKAFSNKNKFKTLNEANLHLKSILKKLNLKPRGYYKNLTPLDRLNEEKVILEPIIADYIIYEEQECRVSKYSTIQIEHNKYSVPDHLVGRFVKAKKYTDKIVIYYDGIELCTHERSYKSHDWIMDINHYLNTFKKKPGALHNSTVISKCTHRIQDIYNNYYTTSPKEFLELLEIINKKDIKKVDDAILELEIIGRKHVTTENIKNIVNQEKTTIFPNENVEETNEILDNSLLILDKLSEAFASNSLGGIYE